MARLGSSLACWTDARPFDVGCLDLCGNNPHLPALGCLLAMGRGAVSQILSVMKSESLPNADKDVVDCLVLQVALRPATGIWTLMRELLIWQNQQPGVVAVGGYLGDEEWIKFPTDVNSMVSACHFYSRKSQP